VNAKECESLAQQKVQRKTEGTFNAAVSEALITIRECKSPRKTIAIIIPREIKETV